MEQETMEQKTLKQEIMEQETEQEAHLRALLREMVLQVKAAQALPGK